MFNNKIQLNVFIRILLLILIFFISIFLGSLYLEGDQSSYIFTYEGLKNKGLVEAYIFYVFYLSSAEFIHFLLSWISSNLGFNKLFIMSLSNVFLSYLIIKLFDRLKVNFAITSIFLLSNFYLFVLFFAAERLKFGFIFFLLSVIYPKRFLLFFSFLSIISHLQMILVYSGKIFQIMLNNFIKFLGTLKINYKNPLPLFLVFIFISYLNLLQDNILLKFESYNSAQVITDFIRLGIFFIISLAYSTNYKENIIIFIPLVIGILLFGDERVNMIGYVYCLYYLITYKNGVNVGMIALTVYLLYSNILFIQKIIQYGNGFAQ